jgi:uncharacterized membrane protein
MIELQKEFVIVDDRPVILTALGIWNLVMVVLICFCTQLHTLSWWLLKSVFSQTSSMFLS